MKLDPIEIAAESSPSLFGRVAAVWLAASSGLVMAGMVSGGDALVMVGMCLFLPIFLFGLAVGSGWWLFLALPAAGVLAWRAFLFIRGDASGRELLSIGLLAFVICIRPSGHHWFMELVWAGVAVCMLVQVYRQKA